MDEMDEVDYNSRLSFTAWFNSTMFPVIFPLNNLFSYLGAWHPPKYLGKYPQG